MEPAVIIMSKAPLPGKTKTRLMDKLTGEECAAFHRACLQDILAEVTQLGAGCYLYYTGGTPADFPSSLPLEAVILRPQHGADLGERMYRACREVLAHHGRVVIIGTDSPDITAETMRQSLRELEGTDLVLGPALDGGYYLIGLKAAYAGLFTGVAWGTARVLNQTLERAAALGLSASLLPEKRDIDTWEDLVHFYEQGRDKANRWLREKQAYRLAAYFINKYQKEVDENYGQLLQGGGLG